MVRESSEKFLMISKTGRKMIKMEKRRTILVYLASLVLLVSSLAFSVSAQSISINPGSIERDHGESFTIDIKVDPEGTEIYAAQYVLRFDSRILNATSQTQGTFLGGNIVADDIDNSNGTVDYAECKTGSGGVTNPGILASITFEVIGTSGTSHLMLDGVMLSDPDGKEIRDVTLSHGSFSITYNADDPAPAPQPSVNPILAEEAYRMLEESPEEIILLDVRTKDEHDAEHIQMPEVELIHIPLSELESRLGEPDKSKKIIVYSKNGADSRTASEMLVQHDFEHVCNMLGGIDEWRINFPISSLLTPHTATPTVAPSVTLAPSPTATASPIASPALASTPASTPVPPEEKSRLPGFGAVFAIMGLLAMSGLMSKREGRR
jgi:rhodanese-related sulfurtransferase